MHFPQRHDKLTISWLLPFVFFTIVVGEMTLIVVFCQGLWVLMGLNYMVKSASAPGPLVGFRGGANLPFFGKQSDN